MRQSRDTVHIRGRDVVATWQVRFTVIFSQTRRPSDVYSAVTRGYGVEAGKKKGWIQKRRVIVYRDCAGIMESIGHC